MTPSDERVKCTLREGLEYLLFVPEDAFVPSVACLEVKTCVVLSFCVSVSARELGKMDLASLL